MRLLHAGFMFAALSVSPALLAEGNPPPVRFAFLPSDAGKLRNWHAGEEFRNGRDWLALACAGTQCAFEPAELRVESEGYTPYEGGDSVPNPGQRLLFRKRTDSASEVIAWFQMAKEYPWLKPGPVTTYYPGGGTLARPPSQGAMEAQLQLPNGQSATFVPMIENSPRPGMADESVTFYLQLRSRGMRQLLGTFGICAARVDPKQYVVWVGDLDGDGEPDYLINWNVVPDHGAATDLYLSGMAKPGQLVGRAGSYVAPESGSGC